MAGIYHPRAVFWLSVVLFFTKFRMRKTLDLETEYSDGSFLVTSTANCGDMMKSPPMIHSKSLSHKATFQEVLEMHRLRMRVYQEMNPAIRPCSVQTTDGLLAAQNRMQALKAAFRNETGAISKEELEKLSNGHAELAEQLHKRICQMEAVQGMRY